MTPSQNSLIENLNQCIYARLKVIGNRVGFCAIRDIPPGIDPLKTTKGILSPQRYISFTQDELKDIPDPVISLIHDLRLYDAKKQAYHIPCYGCNTLTSLFYIHINPEKYNVHLLPGNQMITTTCIKKEEELVLSRHFFFSDSEATHRQEKQSILETLKSTYCAIRPSPTLQGQVGVIAIQDIPAYTNPFPTTRNQAYPYRAITLSKEMVRGLRYPVVEKMLNDFISPGVSDEYLIPKMGLNALDITFFLNHSDKPNLFLNHTPPLDSEYIGFITNRKIRAGDELCIDYAKYTPFFRDFMSFSS